jgi:hypothetical protein
LARIIKHPEPLRAPSHSLDGRPDCVLPDELGVTLGGTCLTLYGQNKTIPVNESCVLDCINSTLVASIGVEGTVFSCSAVSVPSLTPDTMPVCTKPGVSRFTVKN